MTVEISREEAGLIRDALINKASNMRNLSLRLWESGRKRDSDRMMRLSALCFEAAEKFRTDEEIGQ